MPSSSISRSRERRIHARSRCARSARLSRCRRTIDSLDPYFQAAYAGNDTGSYRLLVSTFLSANKTDGVNVIAGNGGNDEIEGAAQLPAASPGRVFHDADNDGQFGGSDVGIAGVMLTLTGTDDAGPIAPQTTVTLPDGSYQLR